MSTIQTLPTTTKSEAARIAEARIAVRAYERWLDRGCPISDGQEDWFAARLELEQELAVHEDAAHQAA